jgi:hypothetical protein
MNESLPHERSECFGYEQRRVTLFQAQPAGLGLFFRPTALSFAHAASLHFAHSALLDEKSAPAEPIELV